MIKLIIIGVAMEVYTSTDAKREFGEVLLKSQHSPVGVTRNGKAVAVVLSQQSYLELKRTALENALIEGEQSGNAGKLDMDEILLKAKEQQGLL